MVEQLHEVEFETRTIGPLVLTTPVLQRLGLREIVNRYCSIAEQADLDYGLVAELVTQSRLSDPDALYDLPGWAERYAIPALYPEVARAGQLNDDRTGRMLDAIYDQRAFIWGDLVAQAARVYQVGLRRLHADTMAMTFAGLFADQPAIEVVNQPDRPAAPLELRYCVDDQQVRQDAELEGVYLLVAGGKAATLSDGEILAEWRGQHKVELCGLKITQGEVRPSPISNVKVPGGQVEVGQDSPPAGSCMASRSRGDKLAPRGPFKDERLKSLARTFACP